MLNGTADVGLLFAIPRFEMNDTKTEDEKLEQAKEFIAYVGPIAIDVPRTLGYFAGVGGAVAFGLIAPELAVFVAAVPLLKLLKRKHAPLIQRLVGAALEGAAKPVGGDSEGCIRTREAQEEKEQTARKAQTTSVLNRSQLIKDSTSATTDAVPYFSTANGVS
ncbi:MAG: hypothetical protein ABI461_06175 [Polyangiaceae bacterium]